MKRTTLIALGLLTLSACADDEAQRQADAKAAAACNAGQQAGCIAMQQIFEDFEINKGASSDALMRAGEALRQQIRDEQAAADEQRADTAAERELAVKIFVMLLLAVPVSALRATEGGVFTKIA